MMHLRVALVFVSVVLGVQGRAQGPGDFDALTSTCPCIPFHQCFSNDQATDLDGLVDDRSANTIISLNSVKRQNAECSPDDPLLERCCSDQPTPAAPQPPQSDPRPSGPPPGVAAPPGVATPPGGPGVPLPITPIDPISVGPNIISECGMRNQGGMGVTILDFQDGQAQYGEFPWMVAVLGPNADTATTSGTLNTESLYIGGGSLISKNVVLTAAHKTHDNAGKQLKVRLGEWNFAAITEPDQHQDIVVRQVITHPRFNRSQRTYNYALLVLEHPARLSNTVGTICLPSSPRLQFDGMQCILSGWGKNVFGDAGKFSRVLKNLNLNIVGYSQCQTALQGTRLGSSFNLHRSFLCAGDQGQDSCTGDGGSPLVCHDPMSPGQYVQVGISSWGIGCGEVGVPGVYAAVAPIVEWINSEVTQIEATAIDERNVLT